MFLLEFGTKWRNAQCTYTAQKYPPTKSDLKYQPSNFKSLYFRSLRVQNCQTFSNNISRFKKK
jgi:hypothetical protein